MHSDPTGATSRSCFPIPRLVAQLHGPGRRAARRGGCGDPTPCETARRLILYLNDLVDLAATITVESEAEVSSCQVVLRGCKFSPHAVGEADLEGKLCPYPILIEEFVNQLTRQDQRMSLVMRNRRPISKDSDHCLVRLQ